MDQFVKEQFEKFLESVGTWKLCYTRHKVSYIAVEKDGVFRLLVGQIEMGTEIDLPLMTPRRFGTRTVVAGSSLLQHGRSMEAILAEAGEGRFQLDGPLISMFAPQEGPRAAYVPVDEKDESAGVQLVRSMYVDGVTKQDLPKAGFDERKVLEVLQDGGYSDLRDLANDFGIPGDLVQRGSSLLIRARSPARFDDGNSIRNSTVHVAFSTGKEVHSGQLSLKGVARLGGRVISRHDSPAPKFTAFRPEGGFDYVVDLPVANADAVELRVMYAGTKLAEHEVKAPAQQAQPAGKPAAGEAPPGPLERFETSFNVYTRSGPPKGEGGSGRVFPVADEDGEQWAIKVINRDYARKDKVKRFRNELAFCFRNRHPHIVKVHDFGYTVDGGTKCPFYVMRLYEATLRDVMTGHPKPDLALALWFDVLAGLSEAHAESVVHRDLKPENVLIGKDNGVAVLADFGIAHFEEDDVVTSVNTHFAAKLRNDRYAAPEQRIKGASVGKEADVFAMGLILNELFTGSIPLGTNPPQIGAFAVEYAPLDAIVSKTMEHRPSSRYPDVKELEAAIKDTLPEHLWPRAKETKAAG